MVNLPLVVNLKGCNFRNFEQMSDEKSSHAIEFLTHFKLQWLDGLLVSKENVKIVHSTTEDEIELPLVGKVLVIDKPTSIPGDTQSPFSPEKQGAAFFENVIPAWC
jgi:hypothetical protein